MPRPDPRHLALGGDDHRWHAVRPVAPRRDRVLLLSRRADPARGGRLRPVEKPRAVCGAGSADVRGRPRDRLRLRFHRHPLADRKSTRLNSSHVEISYAVFCLKKKTPPHTRSVPLGFTAARTTPPTAKSTA